MRKPKLMPVLMYSRLYSSWSKFVHKRGYHYAPKQYPPEPHTTRQGLDGRPITEWYHWCQWCGLRGTTIDVTSHGLSQRLAQTVSQAEGSRNATTPAPKGHIDE